MYAFLLSITKNFECFFLFLVHFIKQYVPPATIQVYRALSKIQMWKIIMGKKTQS